MPKSILKKALFSSFIDPSNCYCANYGSLCSAAPVSPLLAPLAAAPCTLSDFFLKLQDHHWLIRPCLSIRLQKISQMGEANTFESNIWWDIKLGITLTLKCLIPLNHVVLDLPFTGSPQLTMFSKAVEGIGTIQGVSYWSVLFELALRGKSINNFVKLRCLEASGGLDIWVS